MIDREEVKKVANLARLAITTEEEGEFATQLSDILEYFEQLSELDTKEVTPTTRAIDTSNITRPDELEPFDQKESLLEEAPDRNDEFFRVPRILNTEEG
ncbi:MAG: Asp-tRNA(Asn)/Glu-tRNA(Gln) amidotransferase subunit GatC [Spirulinaceae cyanobacterium]